LKDPSHTNWQQLSQADIATSDPRTVGKLLRVLAHAHDDATTKKLANDVEEYFRKRFRQLDQQTALEIVKEIGS
jgi:hypothetical protein